MKIHAVRRVGLVAGASAFLLVATSVYAAGANTTGPYDPTPSTPSANGNGKGHAYGRPAAGSVGNADTKNPPGQLPGPQDNNKGYECDLNSGIAKGNPAHTGCSDDETTV